MTALARQSRLSYRVSVCADPILKMDHTRLVAMIRSSHRTAGEEGEGERDIFIFEYICIHIYIYIYICVCICVCVYVYVYSEREREEERERERARERVAHRSSSRLLKVFQETYLDGGGCRGFCSFRPHSAFFLQSCFSEGPRFLLSRRALCFYQRLPPARRVGPSRRFPISDFLASEGESASARREIAQILGPGVVQSRGLEVGV